MNQARGRPPYDDLLTPMEWATVEWVRHGLTNRQIAERRGVSADAVKFHVADIAASVAFYRDTLGLPHLFTFGELAFFDCGGTRLYLQQGPKGEGVKPESILYFRVADIHAAAGALGDRGVEFVSAPHMIHRHEDGTEEWMAFFEDNEGRPLALMTQVRTQVR